MAHFVIGILLSLQLGGCRTTARSSSIINVHKGFPAGKSEYQELGWIRIRRAVYQTTPAKRLKDEDSVCSGVLICKNAVLTAAHCLKSTESKKSKLLRIPYSLVFGLDESEKMTNIVNKKIIEQMRKGGAEPQIPVDDSWGEVFFHPSFSGRIDGRDLAIIITMHRGERLDLWEQAPSWKRLQSFLASKEHKVKKDDQLTVIGWGPDSSKKPEDQVYARRTGLMAVADRPENFSANPIMVLKPGILGQYHEFGDSGGLVISNGQWLGIISGESEGLYLSSKISNNRDWITKTANEHCIQ